MLEIEHSITTSVRFLENMAEAFSAAYGKKIYVRNNALIFPSAFASGKFEFYNMNAGISMCIIDCQFYETIRFIRQPLKINDIHLLNFNVGLVPIAINASGGTTNLGAAWKSNVGYSTSAKGVEWVLPKDSHLRIVTFFFTRAWLLKNYEIERAKMISYAKEFALDLPLQFRLDLDLESLLIVQEILVAKPPAHMAKLYYEGCAKKLVALTAQRLLASPGNNKKFKYEEVSQIMDIKKRLENLLDQPLPSLEEVAEECSMGRAKFSGLFKAMYGRNYIDFFQEIKMQKAAELLVTGMEVSDVTTAVGFNNLSYFSKVFKEFFKTTPKSYQMKIRKKDLSSD